MTEITVKLEEHTCYKYWGKAKSVSIFVLAQKRRLPLQLSLNVTRLPSALTELQASAPQNKETTYTWQPRLMNLQPSPSWFHYLSLSTFWFLLSFCVSLYLCVSLSHYLFVSLIRFISLIFILVAYIITQSDGIFNVCHVRMCGRKNMNGMSAQYFKTFLTVHAF